MEKSNRVIEKEKEKEKAEEETTYCYNCGCFLTDSKSIRCIRCHTSLASSFKFQRLNDDVSENSHDQSNIQAPNLEQVWIGAFEESLVECDEKKETTCEHLINNYLRPYFASHPNELVYDGVHWFINKIHFKVYSCYPPIGKINGETKYHLEDENANGQQVLRLHSHLIRRIHILPTLESYNRFQKSREETSNKNKNNNDSDTSSSQHKEKSWNEELFDSHIKSFFTEQDIFRSDNNVEIDEKKTNTNTIRRIVERSIPPHRHLIAGEVFISKGVQFRVMACEPSDGLVPLIGLESIINIHGSPLQDIVHLSLQTTYETLSNDQKQMSPEQFRAQYLGPYFKGRVRYINRTQELNLFGVKMVLNCEPMDGIVTELTKIDNVQQPSLPSPLPVDDVQQRREESDWEMAQRLQREEDEQRPQVVIRNAEHFQRLLAGLSQSPHRYGEEQQLAISLVQFLQQFQHHSREQQPGLPIGALERLPLYEYKTTCKNQEQCNANSSSEDQACRICLVEFENGNKVRSMPCFHRYHQECIDRWLEINRKCPICKIDVLQTLRQDKTY